MVTESPTGKNVLLLLLKDFSRRHTITSIAKELRLSRVGVWKALKKLEKKQYTAAEPIGSGKTSASVITMNWENILVEKSLSLYLAEEALAQRRWRVNFAEAGAESGFLVLYGSILYSPQQANDIDLVGVAGKSKFISIQKTLDRAQKTLHKKIHAIHFTEAELEQELRKPNEAFVAAVKKGVVLFGQENFVRFMKKVHAHGQ
ncbi:MAG TPA: HTH domain-containing protein [Candidatus Nanoarchaeia archaeon]|nr:HTH domain-containing protein [Candidatus Nanoarchaeia archaeon]